MQYFAADLFLCGAENNPWKLIWCSNNAISYRVINVMGNYSSVHLYHIFTGRCLWDHTTYTSAGLVNRSTAPKFELLNGYYHQTIFKLMHKCVIIAHENLCCRTCDEKLFFFNFCYLTSGLLTNKYSQLYPRFSWPELRWCSGYHRSGYHQSQQ